MNDFVCPNCGNDVQLIDGKWNCHTNDLYTCWEGEKPFTQLEYLQKQESDINSKIESLKNELSKNRLEQEKVKL